MFLEPSTYESPHGFVTHLLEERVTNQSAGVGSVGVGEKKKIMLSKAKSMFVLASRENTLPSESIGTAKPILFFLFCFRYTLMTLKKNEQDDRSELQLSFPRIYI